MNKRAQVTVYIIIGIIILFSIAISVYIAHRMMAGPPVTAPVDRPIKEHIEICIQQTGADALVLIGDNGGYLDPLNPVSSELDIMTSLDPAEGDALLISDISQQAVPYWFYMSTENTCKNCLLGSLKPSLEKIKQQVDEYVEAHLEECLNSFEPFLEQGYIFETGKVKSDVLLAEESTRFFVNYPVKVKKLDVETFVEDFVAEVDIPFKRIYELADRITQEEKDEAFLESVVFHFISLHNGLEMAKLPPLGAVTHDKVIVTWFKPMVAMSLQQLLLSYIPFIQIDNTAGAKKIELGDNAFEKGFYKGLYLKFLDEHYPFDVNFAYLDWPFYFDITPRQGDILTGEVHIQEFPFNFAQAFQTNYYEFYYDVSAPVLVEVRDEDALKGKGYSFNFALELNVRDNKNFIEWNEGEGTIGYWDSSFASMETKDIETTLGECTLQGDSWNCDMTGRSYSDELDCIENCFVSKSVKKPLKLVKKLFAEEDQKVSDTVIMYVYDAVTEEPINEASILFTCGRYKSVILGATDIKGKLKTSMPLCINGQLSFEKEGYAKKIMGFTIKPDQRKSINVSLEPEVEVTATIKKYPVEIKNVRDLEYSQEPEIKLSNSFDSIDSWESFGMAALGGFSQQVISPLSLSMHWEEENYKVGKEQSNMKIFDRYCCGEPEPLGKNYSAILMIEKIPEYPLEPDYFKTVMLDSDVTEDVIALIPGLYKVTGMLVDKEGFTIEPGCQEICLEYDTDTGYYVEEIVEGLVDVFDAVPDEKPECKTWGHFPEEPVVAKPSLMGGVELSNLTGGYWNVTRAELNRGGVEFYFIQTLKPTCTVVQECVLDVCVDVAEIQAARPYSGKYREFVEPRFITR